MPIRIVDQITLDIAGSSTVVPQSIDNQFMPEHVFRIVQRERLTLRMLLESSVSSSADHRAAAQFFEAQKTEYVRNLLYAGRLVVNRAAFWNNPVLIASALGEDRDSLIGLLAAGVIVPYLYKELSFDEPPKFDVLPQGRAAVESLANDPALSDIVCIRLGGTDPDSNAVWADRLDTEFRQQLQMPRDSRDDVRLSKVVRALLGGRRASDEDRQRLAAELKSMAAWVAEKQPTRNQLYAKYVTLDDPTSSAYREEEFTFELKKWIDVSYASNLPDKLGARTFTPHGMPTPLDVEAMWAMRGGRPVTTDGEFAAASAEILDRAIHAARLRNWDELERQLAVPLPAPHQLSHLDVIEIRSWDTWSTMMAAMEVYVDKPLDLDRMSEFWQVYDAFLRELSAWWLRRGAADRERYAAGVARIWRTAWGVIGLVQLGNELFPVLPDVGAFGLDALPDSLVEVVVETGLYLYQRADVELRRSHAMRGIQRRQRVRMSQLRELYEQVRRLDLRGELLPGRQGGVDTATEESAGEGS